MLFCELSQCTINIFQNALKALGSYIPSKWLIRQYHSNDQIKSLCMSRNIE